MITVNIHPKTAPNPKCCSDPSVLCANCASEVLSNQFRRRRKRRAILAAQQHEEVALGLPDWDFSDKTEKHVVQTEKERRQTVRHIHGERPLAIPELDYG